MYASFRSSTPAILPLAFLQALALNLLEVPVVYLFRSIRCQEYIANTPHSIAENACRSPEVQRAYSADFTAYISIITVLSIVVSGPFGKLSDLKGRRATMAIACCLNGVSDVWLCLCVLFPTLRSAQFILLSAVLTGIGGGFSVVTAAHTAFIADTSTTAQRSYYMGIHLVMYWVASALAPLISAFLIEKDYYVLNFSIAVGAWTLYFLYLVFVLRESRPKDAVGATTIAPTASAFSWTLRSLLGTLIDPLLFVFKNSTLFWLGIVMVLMMSSLGAFTVLVAYCDQVFGFSPKEAGVLTSIMAISRAISVMCILPLFLAFYRFLVTPKSGTVVERERQSLLAEPEITAEATVAQKMSAAQDLLICRICFVIDAVGMIATAFARNAGGIAAAMVVGSMGAPAGPSLDALVTRAAPSGEIGQVLAGFSIIQSAIVSLRGPVLFLVYSATLETHPTVVWWLVAGLLGMCALIMGCLRPSRFVSKET
ncbi:major facilitator superfamily domain-containing protein [Mycena sp. CBHHK59/15]|nr:major facilitator superfamily domain-containing protein [Mycena sp. CBHHK59/15]